VICHAAGEIMGIVNFALIRHCERSTLPNKTIKYRFGEENPVKNVEFTGLLRPHYIRSRNDESMRR
jgi:hypothetical protein